ncbi:hypothetical protein ABPG77_007696 [Micractinium sp. CCAP 211/92]
MVRYSTGSTALAIALLACLPFKNANCAPDCYDLDPAPGPTGCRPCGSGAGTQLFRGCAKCGAAVEYEPLLTCLQCAKSYARIPLDDYSYECMRPSAFACAPGAFHVPDSAVSLRQQCDYCSGARVGVYYTNSGFFDDAVPSWSAKKVCRTCDQLGCPGKCKSLTGCTACPSGPVKLVTGPPAGTDTWIGSQQGYGSGGKAPTLPTICIKEKDLGCAPGKSASGKGCTSCPTGKKLKAIKPLFLPGSDAIQLTPLGKACY